MSDCDRSYIAEIYLTCIACPQQWEGRFDNGEFFYLRWRGYRLGVGFGADVEAAVHDEVFHHRGDRLDTAEDEGGLERALELLKLPPLGPGIEVIERWDPFEVNR